jgi:hypothetical protein
MENISYLLAVVIPTRVDLLPCRFLVRGESQASTVVEEASFVD